MKKYYRQAIAFLLVWFCSGVTMYSYQVENKILGITFTLLSFLYWFIIDKDDQENNIMKGKYRGCDIEVERGGAEFLTFAVFDDGYEVTSGFSESSDSVRDYFSYMKSVVDDYKEHPEDYEQEK